MDDVSGLLKTSSPSVRRLKRKETRRNRRRSHGPVRPHRRTETSSRPTGRQVPPGGSNSSTGPGAATTRRLPESPPVRPTRSKPHQLPTTRSGSSRSPPRACRREGLTRGGTRTQPATVRQRGSEWPIARPSKVNLAECPCVRHSSLSYEGCWNSITLPDGSAQRICFRP